MDNCTKITVDGVPQITYLKPVEIAALVYYYYVSSDKAFESTWATRSLLNQGLIKPHTCYSTGYQTTPRGTVHVKALCAVRLPQEKWVSDIEYEQEVSEPPTQDCCLSVMMGFTRPQKMVEHEVPDFTVQDMMDAISYFWESLPYCVGLEHIAISKSQYEKFTEEEIEELARFLGVPEVVWLMEYPNNRINVAGTHPQGRKVSVSWTVNQEEDNE